MITEHVIAPKLAVIINPIFYTIGWDKKYLEITNVLLTSKKYLSIRDTILE